MKKILLSLLGICLTLNVFAQAPLTREEKMESWNEAKFGLFVHWGIGGAERPYSEGEEIRPITEKEAEAWLKK